MRYIGNTPFTTEQFLEKAKLMHGNKYDYSKSKYINIRTKVIIICPIHGEFKQLPSSHLKGCECRMCGLNESRKYSIAKNTKTTKQFIEKAISIHGDKYDYSESKYVGTKDKLIIICNKHGKFLQTPNDHYNCGCPLCYSENKIFSTEQFIEKAISIHGDKYDYSKVNYKTTKTKIEIICSKHNSFYQTPNNHLNGQGCPICRESLGEKTIRVLLENYNIKFEQEKTFDNCRNPKTGLMLRFDFYLPDHNTCIEFDGFHHFEFVDHFGGFDKFQETKFRDNIKNEFCHNNNIKLIRIPYYENIINDIIRTELL